MSQDRYVSTQSAKYKILPTVLGVGGTSVVRLGERVSDQKLFALKFFKNASINDIQSAEAEYERSKALGFHPHLVNTVDFDTDVSYPIHPDDGGGTQKVMAVLVMDYCPHGTLIDLLMAAGEDMLSEEVATHVCKQLLTVLAYIHEKKIAHCDLKWEQTLLDNDFNVKLADFGSAAVNFERRSSWLGTPSYWSPEQHEDGGGYWSRVDPEKADLFASAVMIHIAFTSKPPFGEANGGDWFWSRLSRPEKRSQYYMYMEKYGIKLSKTVRPIFEALCALNPKDRPRAAELLQSDLFRKHEMSANKYTDAMRKFYESAYPQKESRMKGFEGFRDEMSKLSLHNQHLFRGHEDEKSSMSLPEVKAGDLVSNSRNVTLYMPSHIPTSQSSKVVVRAADVLRDLGAFVTFKKHAPFSGEAKWNETWKRKDDKEEEKSSWGEPNASDFEIRLVTNRKQAEDPLMVGLKIACLDRRLVIQMKHLRGAVEHFHEVCLKFEEALSSPSMTHESVDSKDRFVKTKRDVYRLLPKVLGVGGTSVVRLGERQSDKKKFAMKFFKSLSNSDLENAKEEFRLSRTLGDHPHLVNVVDFEENVKYPLHEKDGSGHIKVPAVLVTDYCPNHSVIDFLMELSANGKHLDEDCANMLILQLLRALTHIHSKRVAHCDLKFEQCLLDERFNLKLLDFGSAAEELRHRDQWLATPSYWSPEQHSFGSGFWSGVDPDKADMFAFGALIHIALTSTPPFAEASSRCPYWSALSAPSGPSRFWKYMKMNGVHLPDAAKEMFLSLMSTNQKVRPSASEFAKRFEISSTLSQENYTSKMRHFREIAFPTQDVNADGDYVDYESKFRDEMAECNTHDRHLFRGSDVMTHRVPNMKQTPDTVRSRSIRFGVLPTDRMSDVARNEFVKLTKFFNSIGGKVASKSDEPFALSVVFPSRNFHVQDDQKDDEKQSQVPVLRRHDVSKQSKKNIDDEVFRVTCKFGRVEVARHPQLSLRLDHLSGDSSQFRDFVKTTFVRIKTSNENEMTRKKKEKMMKKKKSPIGPKLSFSKSSPTDTNAFSNVKDGDFVDNLGHMLHLGFVGACPLVDESGAPLAHLDVPREMEVLHDVIERAGGVRWSALVGSDTRNNLSRALTSGCCILHVSAHGTSSGELLLEAHSPPGTVFRFSGQEFARLIRKQGVRRPRLVVLMNCFSESVAHHLCDVVDHVVCVDERFPILDSAVVLFTRELYRCIFHGKTILSAFRQARDAVRTSTNDQKMKEAAERFKLVGREKDDDEEDNDESEMQHRKFIFPPIDTTKCAFQFGNCKDKPAKFPSPIPNFVGRDNDLVQLLRTFERKRTRSFLMMHGPSGVGKTALATTLGRYMYSHQLCSDLFVIGPNDSERLSAHELRQPGRLLAKLGEDLRFETTLKNPSQIDDWVVEHKKSFVIVDNCEPFFTNKKFLQVLNNLIAGDYGIKVLLLSRKPKRNLNEVMGTVSMSVYPLNGLSPTHAALLFCTSSPRNLTCAEMGPKASSMRSLDENMRQFAMSPVMNLFPSNLPERIVKAASLLEPFEPFDLEKIMQDWERHFRLADKDDDGEITIKEIQDFLESKGYKNSVVESAFGGGKSSSHQTSIMCKKDFELLWREWGPSVKLASILEEKMKDEESEQRYANTFPLESLTTRDVMMLMRVNGLGMFCRAIQSMGVDGSLLSMVQTEDDLEEIGVNTKLHRRKLFQLIRNWKESTQMVTRQELEEAEKMQLSYIEDSRYSSTHAMKQQNGTMVQDDVRIQFAEHIRVSLATAAFMLMRRMRGIYKGYLLKTSESFRLAHWNNNTKIYHDSNTREELVRLDGTYAVLTTLYSFGRYLAFHHLAVRNISVFNDACPIHVYPCLLRSVEFALSGEGVDLRKLVGAAKHPKWELGAVCSGIFQLLAYEQTEIGECMLVPDSSTEMGCRVLSYTEFRRKYDKDRSFRKVFSRISMSCKALHSEKSVGLYCKDGNDSLFLSNEHRGRVVWLHNELCILVKQLDRNLSLTSRDLNTRNQQSLYDQIESLIVEQDVQDVMRGYQRKLMCDNIFLTWCTEAATKHPQRIDPKNCKSLASAMNHGSKLSRNDRVETILRRKRQLSIYGTADLGKSILSNGVGGSDSDSDRKTNLSPPTSPEMPRGVPGLARSSSMRPLRSRFRNNY